MKKFYTLILFVCTCSALFSQSFSEKQILLENLNAPISSNGGVWVEDIVYAVNLEEGVTNFVSYIDGETTIYEYDGSVVNQVNNVTGLTGSILDFFDYDSNVYKDIFSSTQVFFNDGNAQFNPPMSPPTNGGGQSGTVRRVLDFNQDGIADIITILSSTETINVHILNENHEVMNTISFDSDEDIHTVQAVDLNIDGFLDVVYTIDDFGENKLVVQINNSDNTFSEQIISFQDTDSFLEYGDFDGDNDIDLLITGFNGKDLKILENLDGTTFGEDEQIINSERIFGLKTGDLDDDGFTDIAYLENMDFDSLNVMVAISNGDNTFEEPTLLGSIDVNIINGSSSTRQAYENWLNLFDYDNDGDLDVFANAILEGQYVVFENMGTVSYTSSYENNTVDIYPNPVQNTLTFNTDININKVEIMDVAGKIVTSVSGINLRQIDTSELTHGVYTAKIYARDYEAQSKLFVKQ